MPLKKWKRSCEGLEIASDGDYLFTLRISDDHNTFRRSEDALAQHTYYLELTPTRLHEKYAKFGLRISLYKMEYLIVIF